MGSTVAKLAIVGGEAIAELGDLEVLAERVFGRGERRPGWFRRKLVREGVEPLLSALLVEGAPALATVRGYALVGGAPSLGARGRGAGVGLVPELRGRGWGGRLLRAVRARARAAGLEELQFLADDDRVAWYQREGFAVARRELTLLATAAGPQRSAIGTADPGDDSQGGSDGQGHGRTRVEPAVHQPAAWTWVPEFWRRTPAGERGVIELGAAPWRGRAFWSREGRALLIQRLELGDAAAPEQVAKAVAELRHSFAGPRPLLLYPCPATSAWLPQLLAAGWQVAQRSFVVARATADDNGLDKADTFGDAGQRSPSDTP